MTMTINGRAIGPDQPMYIIAELSGNHNHDLELAKEMVRSAAEAGVDAVKLQTYTADSLTIDSDKPWFRLGQGTLWEGRTLHDLYEEAHTPWEWHGELFDEAKKAGVQCFSSPFDRAAVDFLDALDAPAFKIASFELLDLELIEYTASKGRPMILSTGMATVEEIEDGLAAAARGGCEDVALLRCNSGYPADPAEMDLRTIPDMQQRFGVPIGLSDHTIGPEAPLAARALGACILEKHFTMDRGAPGPDAAFSTEAHEWTSLVQSIRTLEQTLGSVRYGPTAHEQASLVFRRSLFVVQDVAQGTVLSRDHVRCIRPGYGLAPRHLGEVLGRRAAQDIEAGTPVSWDLLEPA